jgi:hypothetical protein
MNLLEKQVLQLIGENVDSPDVFADTDDGLEPIRDSINAAIEEVAMLSGVYQEKYSIPLYEGQGFYRLNFSRGQYVYVLDAYLQNNKRRLDQTSLAAMGVEGFGWMTFQGTPEKYMQVGVNAIGFYPRPSSSSDVVELTCAVIPARYTTSTDRIKLPSDFQKAVVHYAVSDYWASRGDVMQASKHFKIYAEHIGLNDNLQQMGERVNRFNGSVQPINQNSAVSPGS